MILTQEQATDQRPGLFAHDEVHGLPATYYGPDGLNGANLSWVEHGWLYIVESRLGCLGDTLASKDTMLRFAQALTVR